MATLDREYEWDVIDDDCCTINIVPHNDLRAHAHGIWCKCLPSVSVEDGQEIIVHNAWDAREFFGGDQL